jgi:hypothetical protein
MFSRQGSWALISNSPSFSLSLLTSAGHFIRLSFLVDSCTKHFNLTTMRYTTITTSALLLALSLTNNGVQARKFTVTNKCKFKIWYDSPLRQQCLLCLCPVSITGLRCSRTLPLVNRFHPRRQGGKQRLGRLSHLKSLMTGSPDVFGVAQIAISPSLELLHAPREAAMVVLSAIRRPELVFRP